jgi:mannose/cellobiose epimerase-like protein (N-acyl-D-glucosamine 2-epimerase family)
VTPDFRSEEFLRSHVDRTLAFYHPRCIDPAGGFFQYFKDDGTVYDRSHRHLVSSTRFVFDYAMAYREFKEASYLEAVFHGLRYLRDVHRDAATGGYGWTINDARPEDRTNHCYGVAFVLLAYACGHGAGVPETEAWMDETWELLERRFWDPAAGLYKYEASPDWVFSDYRGQNANMHMCEAMLSAYEATGGPRYLERAHLLARNMTQGQAAKAGGLVWSTTTRTGTSTGTTTKMTHGTCSGLGVSSRDIRWNGRSCS